MDDWWCSYNLFAFNWLCSPFRCPFKRCSRACALWPVRWHQSKQQFPMPPVSNYFIPLSGHKAISCFCFGGVRRLVCCREAWVLPYCSGWQTTCPLLLSFSFSLIGSRLTGKINSHPRLFISFKQLCGHVTRQTAGNEKALGNCGILFAHGIMCGTQENLSGSSKSLQSIRTLHVPWSPDMTHPLCLCWQAVPAAASSAGLPLLNWPRGATVGHVTHCARCATSHYWGLLPPAALSGGGDARSVILLG